MCAVYNLRLSIWGEIQCSGGVFNNLVSGPKLWVHPLAQWSIAL